jgi:hypothetical protein
VLVGEETPGKAIAQLRRGVWRQRQRLFRATASHFQAQHGKVALEAGELPVAVLAFVKFSRQGPSFLVMAQMRPSGSWRSACEITSTLGILVAGV